MSDTFESDGKIDCVTFGPGVCSGLSKLETPFCLVLVLAQQLDFYPCSYLVPCSVGRNCGGRPGFLVPTLHYISRLSWSHHLPCKVGTVTELADYTAITRIAVTSEKPGFLYALTYKADWRHRSREGVYRWGVCMVERQLLMSSATLLCWGRETKETSVLGREYRRYSVYGK